MPKFVPMPISPRRRAPASVSSADCRYVVAALGAGGDDLAGAELELDARDQRPRGLDGIV